MSTTTSKPTPAKRPATVEKEVEVIVQTDGSVVMVHDDDLFRLLYGVFDLRTQRAGKVEPTADGRWGVDVGPLTGRPEQQIGVFARRDQALCEEGAWVREFLRGENADPSAGRLEVPLLQQQLPG